MALFLLLSFIPEGIAFLVLVWFFQCLYDRRSLPEAMDRTTNSRPNSPYPSLPSEVPVTARDPSANHTMPGGKGLAGQDAPRGPGRGGGGYMDPSYYYQNHTVQSNTQRGHPMQPGQSMHPGQSMQPGQHHSSFHTYPPPAAKTPVASPPQDRGGGSPEPSRRQQQPQAPQVSQEYSYQSVPASVPAKGAFVPGRSFTSSSAQIAGRQGEELGAGDVPSSLNQSSQNGFQQTPPQPHQSSSLSTTSGRPPQETDLRGVGERGENKRNLYPPPSSAVHDHYRGVGSSSLSSQGGGDRDAQGQGQRSGSTQSRRRGSFAEKEETGQEPQQPSGERKRNGVDPSLCRPPSYQAASQPYTAGDRGRGPESAGQGGDLYATQQKGGGQVSSRSSQQARPPQYFPHPHPQARQATQMGSLQSSAPPLPPSSASYLDAERRPGGALGPSTGEQGGRGEGGGQGQQGGARSVKEHQERLLKQASSSMGSGREGEAEGGRMPAMAMGNERGTTTTGGGGGGGLGSAQEGLDFYQQNVPHAPNAAAVPSAYPSSSQGVRQEERGLPAWLIEILLCLSRLCLDSQGEKKGRERQRERASGCFCWFLYSHPSCSAKLEERQGGRDVSLGRCVCFTDLGKIGDSKSVWRSAEQVW